MNMEQTVRLMQAKGCDCMDQWTGFRKSPEYQDYAGRYGNFPGKPGAMGSAIRSEFQQGVFNDVNEVGTQADKKKGQRSMEATSPPGFGGTIKHMQKDHPQISNPYALTWYMYKKGDRSHIKAPKGTGPRSVSKKTREAREKALDNK